MDPSRTLPVGKCILAVVLAMAATGFFYSDLDRYLSFEALKTHRDALLVHAEANYVTATMKRLLKNYYEWSSITRAACLKTTP